MTEAEEIFPEPSHLKMKIIKRDGVHVAFRAEKKEFNLDFLENHPRVVICAGCRKKFPRGSQGNPFPPPDNLLVSHLEQGAKRLSNGVLQVFGKKSLRYYHPNMQCVRKGNHGGNTAFTGADIDCHSITELTDAHKALLRRNFNIDV